MAMSNTFNVSWEASEDDDVVGYLTAKDVIAYILKKD